MFHKEAYISTQALEIMVHLNLRHWSLTSFSLDGFNDRCSNWCSTLIVGMDEVFRLCMAEHRDRENQDIRHILLKMVFQPDRRI